MTATLSLTALTIAYVLAKWADNNEGKIDQALETFLLGAAKTVAFTACLGMWIASVWFCWKAFTFLLAVVL